MLRSFNSGVNGMKAFQSRMDVIGNNIANSNTTAFKRDRAAFADSFSQTLRHASEGNAGTAAVAAQQVGTGASVIGVTTNYNQGALSSTGVQTDLAIAGEGFFVVKNVASGEEFVTRAGDFRLDQNGKLVTSTGMHVQGFQDAGRSIRGGVTIDPVGAPVTVDPAAVVAAFNISDDGTVHVRLTDGTSFVRGQVLLQRFTDPQMLNKEGDNLYSGIEGAGPLGGSVPQSGIPGALGLGRIESGALELSNVDLAEEFAGLITGQRGFQATARVISTSDEVLQEVINLKR
jgi:flagellar hook protein FlgE